MGLRSHVSDLQRIDCEVRPDRVSHHLVGPNYVMTWGLTACQHMMQMPPMALVNDKTFQMRASEGWLRSLDDWRRKQADIPARAEAIRRLVAVGIASEPIMAELLAYLEAQDVNNDPEVRRAIDQLRAAGG